jgi:YD repeat-containing protein
VQQRTFSDGASSYSLGYGFDVAGRVDEIVDSRASNEPRTQSWDVVGNLVESARPNTQTLAWTYGPARNVTVRDHTDELPHLRSRGPFD